MSDYQYGYSLDIRRYNTHENFDTVEELRAAVGQYFTQREKYIVDILTAFPENKWEKKGNSEYQENSWRDYEVYATRWK